jgi:hypothetical protein
MCAAGDAEEGEERQIPRTSTPAYEALMRLTVEL